MKSGRNGGHNPSNPFLNQADNEITIWFWTLLKRLRVWFFRWNSYEISFCCRYGAYRIRIFSILWLTWQYSATWKPCMYKYTIHATAVISGQIKLTSGDVTPQVVCIGNAHVTAIWIKMIEDLWIYVTYSIYMHYIHIMLKYTFARLSNILLVTPLSLFLSISQSALTPRPLRWRPWMSEAPRRWCRSLTHREGEPQLFSHRKTAAFSGKRHMNLYILYLICVANVGRVRRSPFIFGWRKLLYGTIDGWDLKAVKTIFWSHEAEVSITVTKSRYNRDHIN